MMWRRSFLLSLILLLLLLSLYSAEKPYPATMTDSEIYEEPSMISKETAEKMGNAGDRASRAADEAGDIANEISDSVSTAKSGKEDAQRADELIGELRIRELEKKAKAAEAWNIALLVIAGIVSGISIWGITK